MEEQNQQNVTNKSKTGPIIAVIGIIVIVLVGILAYQGMNKPQTQSTIVNEQSQQTVQPTTGSAQPQTMKAAAYKDGAYTVVGNYTSPGGAETIGVTLTLSKGVVTDSQVEVQATRPISKAKQTEFSENYKAQVIGKNIDEISLGKVAGSSLSPKGFNDAVERIKAEAAVQS